MAPPNLYAALNILEGVVVGQCTARHRHQEFLSFLRRLDREFPKSKDLHLVLDNASSHLHANVGAWLDAPRVSDSTSCPPDRPG